MNLLCFGYGQVAKNLVSNLLKKKVNLNLTISTRENSSINTFLAASFNLVPLQEEQGFNVMNFAISSLISEESDS